VFSGSSSSVQLFAELQRLQMAGVASRHSRVNGSKIPYTQVTSEPSSSSGTSLSRWLSNRVGSKSSTPYARITARS
jgi:hypothetical protein